MVNPGCTTVGVWCLCALYIHLLYCTLYSIYSSPFCPWLSTIIIVLPAFLLMTTLGYLLFYNCTVRILWEGGWFGPNFLFLWINMYKSSTKCHRNITGTISVAFYKIVVFVGVNFQKFCLHYCPSNSFEWPLDSLHAVFLVEKKNFNFLFKYFFLTFLIELQYVVIFSKL